MDSPFSVPLAVSFFSFKSKLMSEKTIDSWSFMTTISSRKLKRSRSMSLPFASNSIFFIFLTVFGFAIVSITAWAADLKRSLSVFPVASNAVSAWVTSSKNL